MAHRGSKWGGAAPAAITAAGKEAVAMGAVDEEVALLNMAEKVLNAAGAIPAIRG
ncbi:MAG: hypothetical protein ACKVQA_04380 [Burkholderiales bacterium]